jgi:hypothetical protein
MHWADRARDALAALCAGEHLSTSERRRSEQLAEADATTGIVSSINVGHGAAAAGFEDPAQLGLGDGW